MSRHMSSIACRWLAVVALVLCTLPESASAQSGLMLARRKPPRSVKRTPRPPAAEDDGKPEAKPEEKSRNDDAETDTNSSSADGERDRAPEEEQPRSRRRARIKMDGEADADVTATAERQEPGDGTRGTRWLELALGGRGFTRSLAYHQAITGGQREYQLGFGPAAVLDLAFYPLALALSGPAANIGIVADIEQAIGISSEVDADGTFSKTANFPTSMHELAGGLRYRIPIGDSQIGATAIGGEHAFWFTSGNGADRNQLEIPNTVYRFVRAGADARLAVTADFFITVAAGYRHILNGGGPMRADFPHLTVAGVDGDVGAAYAVTPLIEARLQAGIRRYFYDMRSIAGDSRIAGGAVDQYLSVAALLAVTLDRSP